MSIGDPDTAYAEVLELLHTRSLEGWDFPGSSARSLIDSVWKYRDHRPDRVHGDRQGCQRSSPHRGTMQRAQQDHSRLGHPIEILSPG